MRSREALSQEIHIIWLYQGNSNIIGDPHLHLWWKLTWMEVFVINLTRSLHTNASIINDYETHAPTTAIGLNIWASVCSERYIIKLISNQSIFNAIQIIYKLSCAQGNIYIVHSYISYSLRNHTLRRKSVIFNAVKCVEECEAKNASPNVLIEL